MFIWSTLLNRTSPDAASARVDGSTTWLHGSTHWSPPVQPGCLACHPWGDGGLPGPAQHLGLCFQRRPAAQCWWLVQVSFQWWHWWDSNNAPLCLPRLSIRLWRWFFGPVERDISLRLSAGLLPCTGKCCYPAHSGPRWVLVQWLEALVVKVIAGIKSDSFLRKIYTTQC